MSNKYSYPLHTPLRPLAIAVALAGGVTLSTASYAQDAPRRGTAVLPVRHDLARQRSAEESVPPYPRRSRQR